MAPEQRSRARVMPANEYRRERWRNQMGWTREIHADRLEGAATDAPWDWRLSIAEIERDSEFSAFPGIDRELVLLSGNGVRLRFDDGESHDLLPPHDRLRFAGERKVTGELIDGPTHDFNLMWRRDRVRAALWHRPLVGPMVLFAEPNRLEGAGVAVPRHGDVTTVGRDLRIAEALESDQVISGKRLRGGLGEEGAGGERAQQGE